jgi:hypothetical protein
MTEITADIDTVIKRTEQALDFLRRARELLTPGSPTGALLPLTKKKCPGVLHKGEEIARALFSRDASKPDGLQRICRECMSDARKKRLAERKKGK